MSTIAIVGAGLVGRLLALLLAKQSTNLVSEVSLFDKDDLLHENSTGRIAAAMVAPVAESVSASTHIMTMGQASLSLWPQLLSTLSITNVWWQQGSIILSHPQDLSTLQHFKQRLKQHTAASIVEINAKHLAELEPDLANTFQQGLHLPLEGHIDNQQLYQQTAAQIIHSNIQLFEHCPVKINGNTLVHKSGQQGKYDWIIDCRGMGAEHRLLNPKATLRGVRGEVVRVRAPQVTLSRPVRIMHPRYPLYIVPKGNNQYVIGATEIESNSEAKMSVRSALELLSAAYSVHSGFAEAEIISMQTGLRPTLLDNEPEITLHNNILQVNGLYRHGYLLAPYILQQLLLLIGSLNESKADQWQVFGAANNALDNALITRIEH